jgi:hypothetical protein
MPRPSRGHAARPGAGVRSVRRRRPFASLGCERSGRHRVPLLVSRTSRTPARGKGADGATRGARRRNTAAPRLRRPTGGAASPVHALGCARPWPPPTQTCSKKRSTARRPVSKTSVRGATRRRGPARRAFPRRGRGRGALGCGPPRLTRASARPQGMKQHTGGEARHPPGTRLGSAPRGGPRSGQQPTRHEGTRSLTADAACLGWPRRGGASRATRVAARSWKNGDATDVRRHEGTRTGMAKRRYGARKRGGHGAHSGSAV